MGNIRSIVKYHQFGGALRLVFLSIVIITNTKRFSKKIPGSLVAIVVMTLAAWILQQYCGVCSIETIGDRFTISNKLPELSLPTINFEIMKGLVAPALTIALLGAIESLLSATVADGVTGERHDSNSELIGQGLAKYACTIVWRNTCYGCYCTYNDQYKQRR